MQPLPSLRSPLVPQAAQVVRVVRLPCREAPLVCVPPGLRRHITDPQLLTIGCTCADEWGQKAKRRHTTGTGRMKYLKGVSRRFKNGCVPSPCLAVKFLCSLCTRTQLPRGHHRHPQGQGGVSSSVLVPLVVHPVPLPVRLAPLHPHHLCLLSCISEVPFGGGEGCAMGGARMAGLKRGRCCRFEILAPRLSRVSREVLASSCSAAQARSRRSPSDAVIAASHVPLSRSSRSRPHRSCSSGRCSRGCLLPMRRHRALIR